MKRKKCQKYINSVLFIVLLFTLFIFVSCKEETEKEFMEIVTETTSYELEGVMETHYMDTSKQSEFKVLYKSPDEIKITLTPVNGNDSQVILKNKDGVYVLVPSINKNFKIKSEWPKNGSYPYLLNSLAKDIANTQAPIITEDENTKTIETDTTLYKDATSNKQKIIFDKETNLPKEVQILDSEGKIYIRVVFTKIDLEKEIDEKEFVINDSMTTMRTQIDEDFKYDKRSIKYPRYCPEGSTLSKEFTQSSKDGLSVSSIMTYDGENKFTIVQEFINDKETIAFAQESGYLLHVFGVPTIIKENGVQAFYEGIEYTVASTDLPVEEMMKVLASYMVEEIEPK